MDPKINGAGVVDKSTLISHLSNSLWASMNG